MIDNDTDPTTTTEADVGSVWSRVMSDGPENHTTRPPIPSEILDQMEKDLAAGKLWEKIAFLDQIREEFGIGWAVYLSAFMGPTVNGWLVDVCEALHDE